jgi:hypothetical protein
LFIFLSSLCCDVFFLASSMEIYKICRIWGSHSGGYEQFYILAHKITVETLLSWDSPIFIKIFLWFMVCYHVPSKFHKLEFCYMIQLLIFCRFDVYIR